MKLIEDRGNEKVYSLPANAVRLVINVKTRQVDVECADGDVYQVEDDRGWCKVSTKREYKRDRSEWKGIEKA